MMIYVLMCLTSTVQSLPVAQDDPEILAECFRHPGPKMSLLDRQAACRKAVRVGVGITQGSVL